jgi:hypothetical protein
VPAREVAENRRRPRWLSRSFRAWHGAVHAGRGSRRTRRRRNALRQVSAETAHRLARLPDVAQLACALALPNCAIFRSRRRLRRRVRRSPRRALPWEARPARPRRPGPIAALTNSPAPAGRGYAVFLGFDCPDRGHRVQGGPAGRRMRSAPPTLDPASTHLVLAPTRKAGTEQLVGDIQPPDLLSC